MELIPVQRTFGYGILYEEHPSDLDSSPSTPRRLVSLVGGQLQKSEERSLKFHEPPVFYCPNLAVVSPSKVMSES